jgi:hypothetical protein
MSEFIRRVRTAGLYYSLGLEQDVAPRPMQFVALSRRRTS